MEAVEGHAELGEELERGVHLLLGGGHRVGVGAKVGMPWAIERAGTEDVEPVPRERVPVADGEAEVVLHPSPRNDPIGVVPAECQRVVAVGTLEGDPVGDVGEELHDAGSYCTADPKKTAAESFTSRSRGDDAVVVAIDVERRAQCHGLQRRAFGRLAAGELEPLDDRHAVGVPARRCDERDRQRPVGAHLGRTQHRTE